MSRLSVAHVRKFDKAEQSLHVHLSEVSFIAKKLAGKINLEKSGEIIGLLHDLGKYSQKFQGYILTATGLLNFDEDEEEFVDIKAVKGKIDHSTAGAQFIWQKLQYLGAEGQGKLCGQILALCIASHHSGLINCFANDGRPTFLNRMKKEDEDTHLVESLLSTDNYILEQMNLLANKTLVAELFGGIREMINLENLAENKAISKIEAFNLGFLVRFLFSCLIDADRLNSAEFEDPSRKEVRIKNQNMPEWKIGIERLEAFLGNLPLKNPIDNIRREISESCKQRAQDEQCIYTLTVPTGGGKTYASLRYALHHAQKHKLDRIIYIIPFTSIIDQNAKAIRSVLEKVSDLQPWVLEHHSNLEPETQTWRTKLVSENWDAPVVLTTMVQFLETLFSGGTRGVRRLHQLANSVLIFDEIQTLPINCTHLFCNAINFLTTHAKTTVVLCTATQPLLNKLKSPEKGQLEIPEYNELVSDKQKLFKDLNRVTINNRCTNEGWKAQEIADLALSEFNNKNSCLVIVNTKAWAQHLYQLCCSEVEKVSIFHLSTNQCPAHRKIILDEIRKRLDANLGVLCFSTQLIEAGVDVDFASVIRFLSGLDSIAQAAGRCNRNGKLKDNNGNFIKGQVHVVNPDKETIDLLKDIKIGRDITKRIFSESSNVDLLTPEKMESYYQYYFYNRANDMSYPLNKDKLGRNDDLLNLLSDNTNNIAIENGTQKIKLLRQSFMDAGKAFKAIDAPTNAVIVQYSKGKDLVAELCSAAKEFNAKAYYDLLRKAQKYSVNVFPNVWEKLKDANAIYEIQDDGIYYLDERYYSEEFGLSTEPVAQYTCNIC